MQLEEHQSMPPKRAPTNLDLADAKSITSDLLSLVSVLNLVAQGQSNYLCCHANSLVEGIHASLIPEHSITDI